ncbi:DUF2330 domain-containing protein [bacterium]|nr:DUF2330 domain-containing protein [bacterium]
MVKRIAFLLCLIGAFALADGGFVFQEDEPEIELDNADQEAIIYYEKGWETLILSTKYTGPAYDFLWLIPTPSAPKVSLAPGDIFQKVEDIVASAKRNEEIPPIFYVPTFGNGSNAEVKEKERKQLGAYDIVVISSKDTDALFKWCNKEGYKIPINAYPILKQYINKGWCFTAIRINAIGFGPHIVFGQLSPVKLKFASSHIVYPLKISYINRLSLSPSVVVYDELCQHPVVFSKEKDKIKEVVIDRIKKDLSSGNRFESSILYRLGFGELKESYERTLAGLQPLETLLLLAGMKVEEDVKKLSEKEHNSIAILVIAPYKVTIGRGTNRQLASFIEIPFTVKIRTKGLGEFLLENESDKFPRKVYITGVSGSPLYTSFQDDLVFARDLGTLKFILFLLLLFGPLIYIGIETRIQNAHLHYLLDDLEKTGKRFRRLLQQREALFNELFPLVGENLKDKSLFEKLQKNHRAMTMNRNIEEKAKIEEKIEEILTDLFICLKNIPQIQGEKLQNIIQKINSLQRQISAELARYLKLVREHDKLLRSIPLVFFKKPVPFEEDDSLVYGEAVSLPNN